MKEEVQRHLLDCQTDVKRQTSKSFRMSGGGGGGGRTAPAAVTLNAPGWGGIHPTYGVYLVGGEVEQN
jgi:hypothetical protein